MKFSSTPHGIKSGFTLVIFCLLIAGQFICQQAFSQAGPTITITSDPGGTYDRCQGTSLTLSTDATGTTNIIFQWQKFNSSTGGWENLTTSGAYSGVTSKNLVISNIQLAQAGDYRCIIQGDNATPVFTNIATLIVNSVPALPVTTNGESCGPGSVALSASGAGARVESYVWYYDAVSGEPIPNEVNSKYTTPALTETTTFYVTIVNSFCETDRVPVTAIINPIPEKPVITSNLPIDANAITICSTDNLTLSAPTGFASYLWTDRSLTQQITVTTGGVYSVIVTDDSGCQSPSSDGITVTVNPAPCITTTSIGGTYDACEGSSLSLSTDATGTTNITYQWQKYNLGKLLYENLSDGGSYSGVATKSLLISNIQSTDDGDYRCVIKGDLATDVVTDVATLVFHNMPIAPATLAGSTCGSGPVMITAAGATVDEFYIWYNDAVSGEAIPNENNSVYTTPILNTTTTFYVTISNSFCETARVPVTAAINPVPAKPMITSSINPINNAITICSTKNLTFSAPTGFNDYKWSNQLNAQQITVTTSGTYSVAVTDATGCTSLPSDGIAVTVITAPCNNAPPAISPASESIAIGGKISINLLDLISDPDNNLVLATLSIIEQPTSGAAATIDNTSLVLDYSGIAFSGTEFLRIQVCDALSECTQQQLTIEVAGEIEIYNALSPNGDTKNDVFIIKYVEILESTKNNKVTIFDRWGDIVFETNNYNNTTTVFKGLSTNGKELPSGTYYYRIEFSNHPSKTGYISLKR